MGTVTYLHNEPERRKTREEHRSDVKRVWGECQAAAAKYGAHWLKLSDSREREMAARLAEYPEDSADILVHAIHGAWSLWSSGTSSDFDAERYMKPETIYRKSKFTKYLETYIATQRNGGSKRAADRARDRNRRPTVEDAVRNILGQYEIEEEDIPF